MDKVEIKLDINLLDLNKQTKEAILESASSELSQAITWDDVEDYNLALTVELSLFD